MQNEDIDKAVSSPIRLLGITFFRQNTVKLFSADKQMNVDFGNCLVVLESQTTFLAIELRNMLSLR